MSLSLYNTLTRKQETFKPIKNNKVGLYTCGPTVYQYAHIGNLRTYVFEDVLRRTLEYLDYKVNHVMNITDVGHLAGDRDMGEDKVEREAREQKKSAWDITKFYTKEFFNDSAQLNILPPHITEKATETVPEQIALIEELEAKGFTYKTSDGIYFDTSKLSDYGKLAQLDIEGLQEGARVERNDEKKNLTDFALWKFSYPNGRSFDSSKDDPVQQRQMEWESPWGLGFPGWHVECSAISKKHLGQPFDIHTGGIDHVPVHHTNEIAQSEVAYDKPLANYWMHGEFLIIDEKRMGKSEGNFLPLKIITEKGYNPLAYRYLLLGANYRSKQNFTWKALEGAKNALNKLYTAVRALPQDSPVINKDFKQQFTEKLSDDLNTPQALALMWDMLKSNIPDNEKYGTLLDFDKILGLKLAEVAPKEETEVPDKVQKLLDERQKARDAKDFKKADEIRAKIYDLGFTVEDTSKGQIIK